MSKELKIWLVVASCAILAVVIVVVPMLVRANYSTQQQPPVAQIYSLPTATGVYIIENGLSGPNYIKLPDDWKMEPDPRFTRQVAAGTTVTLFTTGLPDDEVHTLHITAMEPKTFAPHAIQETLTRKGVGHELTSSEPLKAGWVYAITTYRRHYMDLHCTADGR